MNSDRSSDAVDIQPLRSSADPNWLRLRRALWPDTGAREHQEEMASCTARPEGFGQFIARTQEDGPVGFAEASIRTDHVNGTDSSPVAFLEGLYVSPAARRRGVAKALVATVVEWARARGCSELASDTQLENTVSQAVHQRLGFRETGRVVYYNMRLPPHDP